MTLRKRNYLIESMEEFKNKHGIVGAGIGLGFSEKEQKWYGWSHRAVCGFGVGDKIFDSDFGDDNTDYSKHGSVTIKNMEDAKKSAVAFSDYVG